MPQLKTISREAIPLCLDRADRYRLLNDPIQAESICHDVLQIDSDNQRALVVLLLALSDQFGQGGGDRFAEAEAVAGRLHGEYEQHYYRGILWERRAIARLNHGGMGSEEVAFPWIEKAMHCFELAEATQPDQADEARLRWNSCVRLCERFDLHAGDQETLPIQAGED